MLTLDDNNRRGLMRVPRRLALAESSSSNIPELDIMASNVVTSAQAGLVDAITSRPDRHGFKRYWNI
jgi:hypothetical protein